MSRSKLGSQTARINYNKPRVKGAAVRCVGGSVWMGASRTAARGVMRLCDTVLGLLVCRWQLEYAFA